MNSIWAVVPAAGSGVAWVARFPSNIAKSPVRR